MTDVYFDKRTKIAILPQRHELVSNDANFSEFNFALKKTLESATFHRSNQSEAAIITDVMNQLFPDDYEIRGRIVEQYEIAGKCAYELYCQAKHTSLRPATTAGYKDENQEDVQESPFEFKRPTPPAKRVTLKVPQVEERPPTNPEIDTPPKPNRIGWGFFWAIRILIWSILICLFIDNIWNSTISRVINKVTPMARLEPRKIMDAHTEKLTWISDQITRETTLTIELSRWESFLVTNPICATDLPYCQNKSSTFMQQLQVVQTDLKEFCCNISIAQRCPLNTTFIGKVFPPIGAISEADIARDANSSTCGLRLKRCLYTCDVAELFIKPFELDHLYPEIWIHICVFIIICSFIVLVSHLWTVHQLFFKPVIFEIIFGFLLYFLWVACIWYWFPQNKFVQRVGQSEPYGFIKYLSEEIIYAVLNDIKELKRPFPFSPKEYIMSRLHIPEFF